MGGEVIARCKCGLEKKILIGSGMNTIGKIYLFPCLCGECKDIVQGDLKNLECPQCGNNELIPYDEPQVMALPKGRIIMSWYDREKHELTDTTYKCPKCTNMTLKFFDSGLMWD